MKHTRIYQAGDYHLHQQVSLEASQSHHVAGVLRMKVGEKITLFNGHNLEWQASITSITKKTVVVTLEEELSLNRESPRRICLAQAIAKGERMEWIIQKAVELGVSEITPLMTARAVVKLDEKRLDKKLAQWQAIAISACEQSGRNTIPHIHPLCHFKDYLTRAPNAHRFILSPTAQQNWQSLELGAGDIHVLIGPEGGLTPEEIQQATMSGYQALRLGPRILRTETAAITAIGLLQARFGDL